MMGNNMIGKFDNIFDSDDMTDETLTGEEAVTAIAYLTSFAAHDGSVDEEILKETLWELEMFALHSEQQLSEIVDKIIMITQEDSVGALFNAAYDIIPDELITDAFAAAIIILLESGELSTPSRKVLKELEKALEISSEDGVAIIDAVLTEFSPTNEADEGNRLWYESPEGNFSVPIPVDLKKGGKVEEEDSCVKFVDDFGTLLRIDYVPFTAGMDDKMEAIGDHTFLQGFLDNYVSEGILSHFSGSQVLHEGYLENVMAGSYFVVVDMPKGATIIKQEKDKSETRLDAYRGLLSFIDDGFLYVISSQRMFWDGEKPGTLAKEVAKIKEIILMFLDAIEFGEN
jgi:hypothetical protein